MHNIKQSAEQPKPLIIGYYPIRGKAQVPRLLCQYLSIPYTDKLFQLQQWNAYKTEHTKGWDFPDLPFLNDNNFILTESFPICEYIIEKAGRMELLGRDITDIGIVQMYLWTIDTMGSIISINCSKGTEEERMEFKENQWKNNVLPRLQKYQQFVRGGSGKGSGKEGKEGQGWFLGYLTIIDFSIYELIRYMEMLFPNKLVNALPKLEKIKRMIEELPSIKEYESSARAIREMDPSVLLRKLKQG